MGLSQGSPVFVRYSKNNPRITSETRVCQQSGLPLALRNTDRGGSRESCHKVTDEAKNLLKNLDLLLRINHAVKVGRLAHKPPGKRCDFSAGASPRPTLCGNVLRCL